jgi:O-antigen ligase
MKTTFTPDRAEHSTVLRPHRAARSIAEGVRSDRTAATLGVAAVPFILVAGLAAFDGGYYAPAWGWSALFLAWAAAVVLLSRHEVRIPTLAPVWLGALTCLVGWIWLSAAWSVSPTLTLLDGQRALVYLGAAIYVVVAVTRSNAAATLGATVAATALIATYAVVRYGSLSGAAIVDPVGYGNALGLLSVIGLLLAVGLVSDAGRGRIFAAAAAVPLAACTALTYARGPLIALAVGLIVMAALARGRTRAVGVSFAAVGVVAVAALASGGAVAGAPAATALREEVLTLSGHDRERYWAAAWQTALDHPLAGSGAGTFERMWLEHRDVNLGVLDAHNLYLEVLAELGPLGLALLAVVCGIPLVAAWRARGQPLAPAAAGAYAAYLSHAAVDWDWEMPAVTVPALVLAGVLLMIGTGETRPLPRTGRIAALSLVATVAMIAFVGLMGNSALTAAVVQLERGSPRSAEQEAQRASRWSLWSAEPARLTAEAAVARGDLHTARAAALSALRRDPGNVRLWRLLAEISQDERGRAYRRIAVLDPKGPPPWSP